MWKKLFFASTLILGIGLFIFFIQKFGGFGKAIEAVGAVGYTGVITFILTATGTLVFPGLGWWILMRSEGMKVSLWSTLKANFMGFPVNFIAPSMYLGAEPLKTFYLAKVTGEPKGKILATIVVGKFQEMGALLFTMVVAAAVAVSQIQFPPRQQYFVLGALGLLVTLFALAVAGFARNLQPTVKAITWLAKLPGLRSFGPWRRRFARLRARAVEMEHVIRRSFTVGWKTFLLAQAVTLLSALSVMIRPLLYFYFSRSSIVVGGGDLCTIYIVTNLINMLPHTPGALGVMEGGMVGLFRLLGLGEDADAGAYQMVARMADLVLILFGAWLIFHYNLQAMARSLAKGEQAPVAVEENGDGPK